MLHNLMTLEDVAEEEGVTLEAVIYWKRTGLIVPGERVKLKTVLFGKRPAVTRPDYLEFRQARLESIEARESRRRAKKAVAIKPSVVAGGDV